MTDLETAKRQVEVLINALSPDERVRVLLAYCVGRLMLRDARRGISLRENTPSLDDLSHVTDWLSSAVIDDAPWLLNVDHAGRPKKLMKFSDFDGMKREADKAIRIAAQRLVGTKVSEGDEEVVMQMEDGYYIVKLLTPAALDAESGMMQHCIGTGNYDAALEYGTSFFFSLRDRVGKAHATMEADMQGMTVVQLRGKQNRVPDDRYLKRILPLLKALALHVDTVDLGRMRFVTADYRLVNLLDLPDGTVLPGNVYIENVEGVRFPDTMTVEGSLKLANCSDVRMPIRLTVGGSLWVDRCEGLSTVEDAVIGDILGVTRSSWKRVSSKLCAKSVRLEESDVETIADDLVVSDDLLVSECSVRGFGNLAKVHDLSLSDVPDLVLDTPIKVEGKLRLPRWPHPHLPERISGYRSLLIEGAAVETLPEGLRLRELDISNSSVRSFPEHTEVSGRLSARYCVFPSIPASSRISGSIDLGNSKCEALPDGIRLTGKLDVSSCVRLHLLPDDMRVGTLKAKGSSITGVGSGLVVAGEVSFDETPIGEIPGDARFGGDVSARQCSELRNVGEAFFGGSLDLRRSGPLTVPRGLDVMGHLKLGWVRELPAGICVGGNLHAADSVAGTDAAILGGVRVVLSDADGGGVDIPGEQRRTTNVP